jgi:putative ABC transport system permease protein
MIIENLRIAIRAIFANKMRSILTVLGVMIGVAAVIAVVSLVQGMQYKFSSDLQGVGSTYVSVFPDAGEERNPGLRKSPELTYEDGLAIQRGASAIRAFTPIFFASVESKYGDLRHQVTILAVTEAYQEVTNHWVDHGRFFTPLDEETHKRVCTIGIEAAKKLGLSDPIGHVVQLDGRAFTVVGVMEKKGSTLGQDRDDLILIPFATAGVLYGAEQMKHLQLAFQARNSLQMDLAKEQIMEMLRTRHRLAKGKPDDFRILAQEELLKLVSTILNTTTFVMAGVVGIALLVGGIGIMNIMLVSVTERTREIGIRKSIGARRRDVLLQFLIEAIALSGLGGIVGIIGGMLLARLVRFGLSRFIEFPPVHTPLWAVVVAFGFCAILGTIFGIYPAAKASKLDPIDALRYE